MHRQINRDVLRGQFQLLQTQASAKFPGRLNSVLLNYENIGDHILTPATAHPISKVDFPMKLHDRLCLK